MLKRVSAGRSHSPGSNPAAADSTGLPHPFHLPIERPSGEFTNVSNERLLEIERILIDGCDDVLAGSSIVLQLHEDLPAGVRPDISVKLQALDQVCIGVMVSDSEGCDLRRFNPLAQIESERGVALWIPARDRHVH